MSYRRVVEREAQLGIAIAHAASVAAIQRADLGQRAMLGIASWSNTAIGTLRFPDPFFQAMATLLALL